MQVTEAVKALSEAVRQSPEYLEYQRCREEINQDAAIKALVDEYRKLQSRVQLRMLSGQGADDDDTRRFQHLGALLFADARTSGFLMAEMRLQKMMADVFEALTNAAGMQLPLPL